MLAIENSYANLSFISYEELSVENQLTYQVILDYLGTTENSIPFLLYYEPLTPYTGLQAQLPVILAEFPLNSKDDIEVYLELLSTMPEYFDSLLLFESAKAEQGLFMSNTQLDSVIEDCNVFINMEDNYLISTFDSRIESVSTLTDEERTTFRLLNEETIQTYAIPAYELLRDGLESFRDTGCNDMGLCYYTNGRAYYAQLIQSNVGSSRSISEIQVLIETQLLQDLTDLSAELPLPDLSSADEMISYSSYDEILFDLKDSIATTFPTPASVTTTIKSVPTEMEPYLSPAFYLIPPIDNTYENTIYINGLQMTDNVSLYTTLAHEGYPGHLYQTTYFASQTPDPIRSIFNYGGYSEGWATYAEMCSYYLSDLIAPINTILQKNSSLMLGLYAYADLGIHYEGWNLADTIDFYQTYGITDSTTIEQIYALILATPSNYLKYYLGYVELLELKRDCIETWGEEFSQIRFHKAVLDAGPMSFELLRSVVLDSEIIQLE
ncbi:MAG: DUF885 domain-containing protein [Eubacteriales bacterium]